MPGLVEQLRGIRVQKASATVPATTTQNIFTVQGGKVLVKALVGEVTVAIGAGTTPDIKVTSVPTVGSATDVATDVVVGSAAVGATLSVEGDGTALVLVGGGGYALPANGMGFVVPAGILRMATTETTAGATKWDIWYVPLDPGARVVSA
jgi:hypothetical protein